jgi:hypothetical protein
MVAHVLFLRRAGVFFAGLILLLLAGCQADYAAQITNKTSQPVTAHIFRKGPSQAVLGAMVRLGPGDRGILGPVRTNKGYGAFLTIYPAGSPERPLTVDLMPGDAFYEVQQESDKSDSPLRIVEKR